MNAFGWVLGIVYWIGLFIGNVWLCYEIASQKNRNDVLWGWAAVFFGIFATLTVAVLRPLKTTVEQRQAAKALRKLGEMQGDVDQLKTHGVRFSNTKK